MGDDPMRTNIPKLMGPNFPSWRNAIITQLDFKDLGNLIKDKPLVKPNPQE